MAQPAEVEQIVGVAAGGDRPHVIDVFRLDRRTALLAVGVLVEIEPAELLPTSAVMLGGLLTAAASALAALRELPANARERRRFLGQVQLPRTLNARPTHLCDTTSPLVSVNV